MQRGISTYEGLTARLDDEEGAPERHSAPQGHELELAPRSRIRAGRHGIDPPMNQFHYA